MSKQDQIQPIIKLRALDWNDLSELRLIEKINHEILHPLGLAMSRDPNTGGSNQILVAADRVWEYPQEERLEIEQLSVVEIKSNLEKLLEKKGGERE